MVDYLAFGNNSLSTVVRTHNNRCITIPIIKNTISVYRKGVRNIRDNMNATITATNISK